MDPEGDARRRGSGARVSSIIPPSRGSPGSAQKRHGGGERGGARGAGLQGARRGSGSAGRGVPSGTGQQRAAVGARTEPDTDRPRCPGPQRRGDRKSVV